MRISTSIAFLLLPPLLIDGCGCGGGRQEDAGPDEVVGLFTESGELMAVSNTNVNMPGFNVAYGEPQITWLAEEGTVVAPSDTVARMDVAGVLKELEDKQSELAISLADLSSTEMSQATEINKLEGALLQAESRFQQTVIDTQRVAYESKSRREETLLQLEKAEISLEKARRKIESTKLLQQQDLMIRQIKIEQTRRDIKYAKLTLERFTILAPAAGMIVYTKNRRDRSNKIKVGDNLRPGWPLIQLPDLSRMKALTSVNETDINKIWVGQSMRVRLDAYPRVPFEGEIVWISSTCRHKKRNSKVKVFDVEVLLTGNDKILKPGMTVSCEFLGQAGKLALSTVPADSSGQAGE